MSNSATNNDIMSALQKVLDIQQRQIDKLDGAIATLVPRVEYEARHTTLEQLLTTNSLSIADNNRRISELGRWAIDEHAKLGTKLETTNKETNERIDKIVDQQNADRATTIRYIVSVAVSFIVGIVIPVILFFVLRR